MKAFGQMTTNKHRKGSTIANRARFSCRMWCAFGLMLLLSVAATLSNVGQLRANDFVGDEPFLAEVISPNACLRSGPGDDYYVANRIEAGQVLEVYYVISDQWCAVRPPAGSFTWVDARNVRLSDNQIGEVLINGVKARVGSELGNMCGTTQVVLDRGERVFVFERVETPNDIDTPVWYKIAPPAGEFRFIRMSELQFDLKPTTRKAYDPEAPKPLRMRSPIVQVADMQPQRNEQTQGGVRSQPNAPSPLSSQVVPPSSLPIPETLGAAGHASAGQHSNGQLPNNAEYIASTQRPSTVPGRSNQSNTQTQYRNDSEAQNQSNAQAQHRGVSQPQHQSGLQPQQPVARAIDSDDFREILEQLKLDFSEAMIEQETAVDAMQSLSHQARMLYQTASDASDRAEVYRLIAGIERATRVRRNDNENAAASNKDQAERNRNDGRTMQLTSANQPTNANQSAETNPQSTAAKRPSSLPKLQNADRSDVLPLPRLETAHATPEPNDTDNITQYSAQESFFDRNGRYYRHSDAGQSSTQAYSEGQYSDGQDFEIYLRDGQYVDASGRAIDSQMLGEILHNSETVLMLDPNTGEYYQVPPQDMFAGQFVGRENGMAPQQVPAQKNWVQRLVSGELFRGSDQPASNRQSPQQYTQHDGSGYAPYTYQLAYGDAMPQNNTPQGYAFRSGSDQGNAIASAMVPQASAQSSKPKGFFASSQPSLLSQQQPGNYGRNALNTSRSNAAYRGGNDHRNASNNVPNANASFPNNGSLGMSPGMIQREFVLPQGVEMTGEGIVYDESQGIDLLGDMQNLSQQDQIAFLIQHMAVATESPQNYVTFRETPRPNLPLTEAEARMLGQSQVGQSQMGSSSLQSGNAPVQDVLVKPVQLMALHQNNGQVASSNGIQPAYASSTSNASNISNNSTGSATGVVNHQVTGRIENGVGRVAADAFDAIGRLGRVNNATDDMPKYVLADETGKAICLITPTNDIELGPHVGKTLGITGIRGSFVSKGKTFQHISAKAVYPITR